MGETTSDSEGDGYGPDDGEREGLSPSTSAEGQVMLLLRHKRSKLGREPTAAELQRWGAIYVRIGRMLEDLARGKPLGAKPDRQVYPENGTSAGRKNVLHTDPVTLRDETPPPPSGGRGRRATGGRNLKPNFTLPAALRK
jgi:hypothetical protein